MATTPPRAWHRLSLCSLLLLLFSIILLPLATATTVEKLHTSLGGFDQQQFEAWDEYFEQSAIHRPVDSMTDDELADELRRLIQVARPASTFEFPEVDLTEFNAYHDQLAQIFDPTGEHRRAAPPKKHSRRLSYVKLISKSGFAITELVQLMDEENAKTSTIEKVEDISNIFVTFKPSSCKWRHLRDFPPEARDTFEQCTGVKAAVAQVEEWNRILFIVSSLLSPLGMSFLIIEKVILSLMERSCQTDVNAAPKGKREFWSIEEIFDQDSKLSYWEQSKRALTKKKAAEFAIDYLLAPIYNLCRFLGKLGIKSFEKAAKAMRPYMKASRKKEESFSDWCDKQSRTRRYLRRMLELRGILNDLAPTTQAPSPRPSGAPSERRLDLAGAPLEKADWGKNRQLTGPSFNFTAAAEEVFRPYMTDLNDVMMLLAELHDWDEALLTAWLDSGIEDGLRVLYEIIDVYEGIMSTISTVFEATLGELLEFAKTIIDKLGQYICDSDDTKSPEALATNPPAQCGIFGQILNFIKSTVDILLGFIDGAIDYLLDLLNQVLVEAIPELAFLFDPFNFDFYWDDLLNVHVAAVNISMVAMFDKFSSTFSLENLLPNKDLALFTAQVVQPRAVTNTVMNYTQFPDLTFSCSVGHIPIVLSLSYIADNCDFELGPPFRFPCNGTDRSCIRTDIFQFVRSCFSKDPVVPTDFLPANYEKYVTNLNYMCFNTSNDLSVLGELIRFPKDGQTSLPVGNPQVSNADLGFEGGLKLKIGKFAAQYPDSLTAGFNTVFYIEEASLPNDLCYSDAWSRTTLPLPADFRYKWWLCYTFHHYGFGNITNSTTDSSALANAFSANVYTQLTAIDSLMKKEYVEYNTCQYKPAATNRGAFIQSYTDATKQIDCAGTVANNGATSGPFTTSCPATLVGGDQGEGTGYYDTQTSQWTYRCQDGDDWAEDYVGLLGTTNVRGSASSKAGYTMEDCWLGKTACGLCCVNIFNIRCCSFDYSSTISTSTYQCAVNNLGSSGCPDCTTYFESGWSACDEMPIANRKTELQKKFDTLKLWLDNRQSCEATIAACTGQKTCDWSNCKPAVLEYALTNELMPRFNNSAVRFAFYGGMKQINNPSTYQEKLTCALPTMKPVIINLEASWALFTSYSFNVTRDVPLTPATASDSAYYSIKPTSLKTIMGATVSFPGDLESITFRAEYKCLCPPGYELEGSTFNDVLTCTACTNGWYRSAGMDECAPCPMGTYEDGTHTQCVNCPMGTYNNVTAKYNNVTTDPPLLACLTCPLLHVSMAGAHQCYPCNVLDPVTSSYFPNGGGPNTWALNGTTCVACPDHLFTNQSMNSTTLACTRCENGYYRFQNMTDCDRAPPGMYMDDTFESSGTALETVVTSNNTDNRRRRSLLYLVGKMRRHLQQVNSTAPNAYFPLPAKLLACPAGSYSPAYASSTCLSCPRGSYQPDAGENRCLACRVGFTTREYGSLNSSACVPVIPDDFNYPLKMTCLELLEAYATVEDIVLIGDGLCNRGPLNTPNCGYDGGDCCPQTCRPNGQVPIMNPEELYDLSEIQKWTNDTDYIASYNESISDIDSFVVYYSYSCSPYTFDCRDPNALLQPLNCSAPKPPTPDGDTFLNSSCGDYQLDANYGDGFCDERLNYQECGYDGGDCCVQTCRLSRLNGQSCSPSSFNCRDPRSNDSTLAYINPPLVYKECYPFYYDNGFRDLRVQTAITTNPDPCAQGSTAVSQRADVYSPAPACPGNFTLVRTWDITDLNTSISNTQTQTVNLFTTTPPNHVPRPICLWRNGSTRSRPYSFGKLQTSPFFGFGDIDLCTVTIDVDFVTCTLVSVGSSSAQCLYNSTTDELLVTGLEDNDVWEVTVTLTDSCGNGNQVSSTVAVSSSTTPMSTDLLVSNVSHPCVEASPYEYSVVVSRLPLRENRLADPTAQVCTETTIYDVPAPPQLPLEEMLTPYQTPPALKICLAVTREPRQCAASATSGRLRTVFLDTVGAFGIQDPTDVEIVDASIHISGRCNNVQNATSSLSSCQGLGIDYSQLSTPDRPFNLALVVNDTTWAGTGDTDLGCFFVKAFGMTRPTRDIDIGLIYSNVNDSPSIAGFTSVGINQVGTVLPPPLNPPNGDTQNVISNRIVPSLEEPQGKLACVRIKPQVVDASTTALCLSMTTDYPGCVSSSPSGSLEVIYLDTAALGLTNPFSFSFETSHDNITVLRPYCVRTNGSTAFKCHDFPEPPQIAGHDLLVAIPVDPNRASWNAANQDLGCLHVTHPDLYHRDDLLSGPQQRRELAGSTIDTRYLDWALMFGFRTPPEGVTFIGGLLFTDPPPIDTPSISNQCSRNTVFVRSPQGDNQGSTTQVCTAVDVNQPDNSTLEVCLAVDSQSLPQCVSSSRQGQLRAVFMDTTAFGNLPPEQLSLEDGTIMLNRTFCTSGTQSSSVLTCNGFSIAGLPTGGPNSTFFNEAFLVSNFIAWNNTRNTNLGCFYVKRYDGLALTLPPGGWSLGFAYSHTDGSSMAVEGGEVVPSRRKSLSAGKICTTPERDLPQCDTKPSKRIIHKTWKGMVKDKSNPDREYNKAGKVCTRVKVTKTNDRTLQICLTATTQGPGCQGSAVGGTLAGVFFDSTPFGVQDSRELNIENGTIQFKTPYCTYRRSATPDGAAEKKARIDRCGALEDCNSLRLNGLTSLNFDVGLTVANNVSWSGGADKFLGCFYVTGPQAFDLSVPKMSVGKTNSSSLTDKMKAKTSAWEVGLRFNDVVQKEEGKWGAMVKKRGYAIMLGKVCSGSGKVRDAK